MASCTTKTTTTTSTQPTTKTTTTTTTTTTTATTTLPTTTTTTTTTGNWWDKDPQPQYGGTLVLRQNADFDQFDPSAIMGSMSITFGYMEQLFGDNWTVNPSEFTYQLNFRPDNYLYGQLAKSWSFTAPNTLVIELRQGIKWQNIAPANGREFVADDITAHFNRVLTSDFWNMTGMFKNMTSVTSTGKYEVTMKFALSNPEWILGLIAAPGIYSVIESPEAVKQWGNLNDWHHAIGTGPFILTDYISNSSVTLTRNPNYWGTDERYPNNKLPYLDEIKWNIIADDATALAGLRTGKISIMDGMGITAATDLKKTSPAITQIAYPAFAAFTIDPRYDKAPWSNIKVRQALQMSLNLPSIAQNYYGGYSLSTPAGFVSDYLKGWGYPYDQWTQAEKDQYAYNVDGAKQLLADAGYSKITANLVCDAAADQDLIQLMVGYFAAINVNVTIVPMESGAFGNYQGNHSNMELCARKVGTIGKANEPISLLGTWEPNTRFNVAMVNDPTMNDYQAQGLAATTIDQAKSVVAAAAKYMISQHFVITLPVADQLAFCQPYVHGFNAQNGSISGPGGPSLLNFYGARWWIDSSGQ